MIGREAQKLFVIFPNESSFYEKMGVELFESDKEYEKFFVQNAKTAGIDFSNTLFYTNETWQWDTKSKQIAVLMTSVALYNNWHSLFEHIPDKLIGYGIGYISALVCAGVISLKSAIQVINGQDPRKVKILKLASKVESLTEKGCADNKDAIIKRIKNCLTIRGIPDAEVVMSAVSDTDMVLEVGPDNLLSVMIKGKISSYYDSQRDCNHLLENVKYRKYFNRDYLILRFLGMMVSARNYNEDKDAALKISLVYGQCKEIADKIRMRGFGNTPMAILPGRPSTILPDKPKYCMASQDDYFAAIAYLRTIFELKGLPENEVAYRLSALEMETLLTLQKDYNNVIVTII